jgi:class 3 adenylate cyclase/tetratricopeptide (TPR) repeat protein
MRCPRCQAENREGRRFCADCGASFSLACPSCGFSNEPGEKFCGGCGQPLRSVTPTPTRFRSPESYTPKHLAEKVLTSKSALEGERKQVTVLFADVKGSMELLADRDPEDARRLLDPVLERMMEAVHRYEGTVNQVMGDGIMALFGAPVAHEDHAIRACYAALWMQDSVKDYAEEVHRTFGVPLHIRMGLNSGEVVVRAIGSDLRMDYTAVGQTTHLAARMEQMAMPGSILIPADTLRLAEGYVAVRPLGPRPVKGLEAPIEVYEITGAGTTRSRLRAAAARGLTRFVGRDDELEQLHQALERARTGHGQVVAVVGEPGVGRSRLLWEFTHSQRTQGCLILESGSVSYEKATPYLPVVDLLKTYFKIRNRRDPREIGEKVAGKLLTLDEALKPTIPSFLALLDVPVEDGQWQRLDPLQRRQRTLDALQRLLLRESQVQPLIVVFEDLQWVDSETQALLDRLIESLPTARLLLLLSYRPQYQHGWGGKTHYRQLQIGPLPPEKADELLTTLLGIDAGLQPLKRLLIARTEGNPFFMEESVRTLVETTVLGGERGNYHLAKDLEAIQVPATVQAILAARIDRLPPEEKQLLQAASVMGKEVPFILLQAIAELPEADLRRSLTHLQAAEFLYEESLFPDLRYSFKHALTHEVVYGSLLQERRRALHAQIAEAIERLYADRLIEQADQLAQHAFGGEMWEKAVTYLRQAGTRALERSAYHEAVASFDQALAALQHLPETGETLTQAIDLRFALRTAHWPMGELEKGFGYLSEAGDLASKLGDPRRLGWASAYMSHYLWMTGRYIEGHVFGQRAHAIAETLGEMPLQLVANFYLGLTSFALGEFGRAEELFRKCAPSLEDDLSRECFGLPGYPSVMSRAWLALSLAGRGEFDEGITYGREGLRMAQTLDHPFSLGVTCWGLASLYDLKGEFGQALPLLERALALSREWNLTVLAPFAMEGMGYGYALSGRVAEGISFLQEALTDCEALGLGIIHSQVLVALGEACVLAQRLEDALAFARRALMVARERKKRGSEAWALRLLGEIACCADGADVEEAETHYHQAMALASELGMRPLVARCHLGLGKLYRRSGRRQQAQEHLTTATALFREMDMGFWRENADREMKELG